MMNAPARFAPVAATAMNTETLVQFVATVRRLVRERLVPIEAEVAESDAVPPHIIDELNVMTQSLAVEWSDRGIRCNAIAPGAFPTEGMNARLRPDQANTAFRDTSDYPMGCVGDMPELANLAAFLMSPGAEYPTGQTIAIDGARYLATGGNFASLRSWDDAKWAESKVAIQANNGHDRAARTT